MTDEDIMPILRNQKKMVYDGAAANGDTIFVDAFLHHGMRNTEYWHPKKRACRDEFNWVDDDGLLLSEQNGGTGGIWEGLPAELFPMVGVDSVVKTANEELQVSGRLA